MDISKIMQKIDDGKVETLFIDTLSHDESLKIFFVSSMTLLMHLRKTSCWCAQTPKSTTRMEALFSKTRSSYR